MAEDLAFLAGELGLKEDADYFVGEYRRARTGPIRTSG